jgi:hypothetical protein
MGGQQADLPATAGGQVRRPCWRQRLRARVRNEYQEDGVFRPVRLPLWADLAVSAVIVALATGAFVGFFVWLARTQ